MSKIEDGYRSLSSKWIFKVKFNVNDDIAQFKTCWVVREYLEQFDVDFD